MLDYRLLVTGALLGLAYSLKSYAWLLFQRIKSRYITSLSIEEKSFMFHTINHWLLENHKDKLRESRILYIDILDKQKPYKNFSVQREAENGWFIINHKGHRLLFTFATERGKDDPNIRNTTITIRSFYNKTIIDDFIIERYKEHLNRSDTSTVTQWIEPSSGMRSSHVKVRPIRLDKIAGINKRKLQAIVSEFLRDKDKYTRRGLPYRLGITLYGEPGCGKSALVAALALHYGLNLVYVNLAYMSDVSAIELLQYGQSTNPCILYIEEIETVFDGRDNIAKANNEKGLTFSTFLNLLSGTIQVENAIVITTTNHIEKLDPALKRAGRLGDHMIEFKKPTKDEAEEYLSIFFELPIEQCALSTYREIYNFADLKNICLTEKTFEKAKAYIESATEIQFFD